MSCKLTLMWHIVVIVCVFKSKTFIITFYCILCYRDPVPKRGNLHALLPVTIPLPYTIQVRLLYILTGGDVIETSCMWNFIKVLCLDTSQTFCFGTENFFLSLSPCSLFYLPSQWNWVKGWYKLRVLLKMRRISLPIHRMMWCFCLGM